MDLSPEVLIYIQTVKNYLNTNEDAKKYFLSNGNEEFFFKHLSEISQKNFEKDGDVMLSKIQFELLRKTTMATSVLEPKNENIDNEKIFIEIKNFGKICLN